MVLTSYFDCCLGVQCPALTSPANGRVLVPSRLVGGVARYSCSQGFSLTGSSSRTCLSTGRWNGVQPTCQPEGAVEVGLSTRIGLSSL